MKSAEIKDGVVVNVIVGTLKGHVECPDIVQMGWKFDGSEFTAPPQPVLTDIEQAQNTLDELDRVLPRAVEDIIEAMQLDTSTLPAIMQERLAQKKSAREILQT